ncbi:hypothetical protein BDY24DRAFT_445177 [Mrakia frigida]|uniref:U4/U6-U5 snRNP complex subunit SNU23 n=1 Tax=Mrakia frigida TaxID=29902 RepID=UPI003FCC100B
MADKVGAYGAQDNSGRDGKWDLAVFAERAKEKDKEASDRAKENEAAMMKGKKPARFKEELPKATKLLEQRTAPLELENNLGKTMIVNNPGGRGAGQPGFYCDICKRVSKDSIAYLDHLNGRTHLRRLGQTTSVARSSLDQVRTRIALLRSQTHSLSESKRFDFETRLAEVQKTEENRRLAEKDKKRRDKEDKRKKMAEEEVERNGGPADEGMMGMMGFGGFGGGAKGRR